MNTHPQFFDTFGRCLPDGLTAPVHRHSRRRFLFRQPDIDYTAIHARSAAYLDKDGSLSTSAADFTDRVQAIRNRVLADPLLAGFANGVGIPFMIPANKIDNYGSALENRYIPAVGNAFKMTQPNYDFNSHNPVHLAGKLTIAPESRHSHLVEALRQGDVAGWLYPCLLEYSIPAAREAIANLPECCLLAGGVDTCAALVGSPDLFLRIDGYPPLLWLAALDGEKPGVGYHFEAYGYNLTFNRRPHLGQTAEYWAGAVVVIG